MPSRAFRTPVSALRLSVAALAAAGAALAWPGAAGGARAGEGLLRRYRLRKVDTAESRASSPIALTVGGPECIEGVPEVLGTTFDPAAVDEIAIGGDGRIIVWASTIAAAGLPGATRDILVRAEGQSEVARLSDAAGDNDQPSVDIDAFGSRIVWRGSDGARGATTGNIYLRTLTRAPEEPEVEVVKLTSLVATATSPDFGTAFDPTLAARTRVRDAGSGVKVEERDARVAFVSTGNLDRRGNGAGENPDHRPQLFLWREQEARFEQITSIADAGFTVRRPSISQGGDRIAFECDADLTPFAVDPSDPSRIGNPSNVRQVFLWTLGRGIRQLTWSDGDCLAPRISRDGRSVLFQSKGEPIPGANPEGNWEIFQWQDRGAPSRRLRQLTQTAAGHNVLPRPTSSPSTFVFWSTSTLGAGGAFGASAQCGPAALLWSRGEVSRIHGFTDAENLARVTDSPDPENPEGPVFTGPPAPGAGALKVHFATNDPSLNEPDADDDLDGADGDPGDPEDPDDDEPDDRDVDVSLFIYHVARATRYAR